MTEHLGTETERVRRILDREAPKYDRQMGFFDRVLFSGGREWACAEARGEVLELAIGTARNLPYYADDVRLTGVELSPAMLAIARRRSGARLRRSELRHGDHHAGTVHDPRRPRGGE